VPLQVNGRRCSQDWAGGPGSETSPDHSRITPETGGSGRSRDTGEGTHPHGSGPSGPGFKPCHPTNQLNSKSRSRT
jgi:hypothetical protein